MKFMEFFCRSSSFNTQRIDEIYKDTHESNVKLFSLSGDLTDFFLC